MERRKLKLLQDQTDTLSNEMQYDHCYIAERITRAASTRDLCASTVYKVIAVTSITRTAGNAATAFPSSATYANGLSHAAAIAGKVARTYSATATATTTMKSAEASTNLVGGSSGGCIDVAVVEGGNATDKVADMSKVTARRNQVSTLESTDK